MHVRNSAKALVICDDKILLNRCASRYGEYYALPGGGQRPNELLTETVVRELREETGLGVAPIRLCGVYERLCESRADSDSHKIYFIFLCRLSGAAPAQPTELDAHQIDKRWVPLSEVSEINLFPRVVRDQIIALTETNETLYLGSERRK